MGTFLLILQYLPAILQAVVAIEKVVGAGNGKSKKDIVLAAIQAVANVGETVDQKTVQALSGMVDSVVAILNASGVFQTNPKGGYIQGQGIQPASTTRIG